MARSLYSEANTWRMADSTFSMPEILRKVSCCPAKDASDKSSAVAEERIASVTPSPACASIAAYASRISFSNRSGNSVLTIHWRIWLPACASAVTSATSSLSSDAWMRLSSPSCAMKSRYVAAVVAKPPGTRTPKRASWLIISPSDAFLPPTLPTSPMRNVSNQEIYFCSIMSSKIAVVSITGRVPHDRTNTQRQGWMSKHRSAFFISDRTGLTAEVLGRSLLSQFDGIEFRRVTLRYIDTPGKARDVVAQINEAAL